MELIDLGKFPPNNYYSKEVYFLHEDREIGIYSASIYNKDVPYANYIFHHSKSTTDFIIYSDDDTDSSIFISLSLTRTIQKKGKEVVLNMFSVSKEEFIGVIRQEKHPALDWLLFNQDLWNK